MFFSSSALAQKMKTRDVSKDKVETKKVVKHTPKVTPVVKATTTSASKNTNAAKKKASINSDITNKAQSAQTSPVVEDEYFYVELTNIEYEAFGGNKTFRVSSSSDWEIAEWPLSWGHLTRNQNDLTLSVDANTSTANRSDSFVLSSHGKKIMVQISQKGAETKLELSTSNLDFSSSGQTKSIYITTNDKWRVIVPPTIWCNFYVSEKFLTVTASANTSPESRNDYMKIQAGDKVVTIYISQEGSPSNATTSTSTSNYTFTPYYSNSSYTYKPQRDSWSKGRFSLGWNLFNIDAFANTASVGSGLRFRVGRYSDFLNLILGANYTYQTYYDNWNIIHLENIELSGMCHQITASAGLNLNLFKTGKHSKFYIGCMGEYGLWEKECTDSKGLTNAHTIAVIPRIGFASKHCDWGFYYKRYLKDKNVLKSSVADYLDLDEHRIGLNVTWYF